jgi:hypothetical protein
MPHTGISHQSVSLLMEQVDSIVRPFGYTPVLNYVLM